MSNRGRNMGNHSTKHHKSTKQWENNAKNRGINPLLWAFGYYILEIPRASLETALDLFMRYGFDYYDIRVDEEGMRASLTVSGIQKRRILAACRVWQIRVKRVTLCGLPDIISNYRGRWGLAVGGILALVLFLVSQSVVWRIDVVGNERLSTEYVKQTLSTYGLTLGASKSRLNTDFMEQRIMIDDDDIAWISVKISGTVARVELREVIDTDITKKETLPANLVSRFDAQIVGMEVYSGFLSVKEGDFVRAGELLVSGVYKSEKAPLRFLRASGRILGRVTRQFSVEIPLKQTKKVPTGEQIEKKTLNFFGKTIKLFINYRNLPMTCDIINYVYIFNPFSLGELPISISVDTYYPYETLEVEISESEAMELAYEELRNMIDEELPDAQILKKTVHGELTENGYILNCTLTAICDIAKQVEFDVID